MTDKELAFPIFEKFLIAGTLFYQLSASTLIYWLILSEGLNFTNFDFFIKTQNFIKRLQSLVLDGFCSKFD